MRPLCIECNAAPQLFGQYCSPRCRGRAGAKKSNVVQVARRERRIAALCKGKPRKCSCCGETKPKIEFLAAYPEVKLRQSCRTCRGIKDDGSIDAKEARVSSVKGGDEWKPKPYRPWSSTNHDPFEAMADHAGGDVSRADICPMG